MAEIRVRTEMTEAGAEVITLSRSDKANALSTEMLATLRDTVRASRAPVLIITGEGSVFSAGADLKEVKEGTLATSPLWEELSTAIAEFDGLTIAALNGPAAGGALGMVLACDLRVAVPSTTIFYPVIRIGVLPQPSDPARLAALIGPARAKQILLTGQKVNAQTALEWGLLDRVTDGDLLHDVMEIAAPALATRQGLIGKIKGLF